MDKKRILQYQKKYEQEKKNNNKSRNEKPRNVLNTPNKKQNENQVKSKTSKKIFQRVKIKKILLSQIISVRPEIINSLITQIITIIQILMTIATR